MCADQGPENDTPVGTAAVDNADPDDALACILAGREADEGQIVDVDAETIKTVVFAVRDDLYAFPGHQVAEILPLGRIWPVPGCPPALEGVIDVRGVVWSVLGLAELIGAGGDDDSPTDAPGAILLGRVVDMQSGLRVGPVLDVLDVPLTHIMPPPETLPEPLRSLALGVVEQPVGGAIRRVVLLDMQPLFAHWRERG